MANTIGQGNTKAESGFRRMLRQNRNALLFLGFLLLAGVIHACEEFVHDIRSWDRIMPISIYSAVTVLFCLTFIIYAGLLLFWIRSVHNRLLPSRIRTYMIASAALMIFYLALRVFKYRITEIPAIVRLTWYAYYVPMTMIPGLFLLVCVCIRRSGRRGKWDERLLLLPAVALSILFMTNDLHHWIFKPRPDIRPFYGQGGSYSHGLLFYASYAWMFLALAAGMILLLIGNGRNLRKTLSLAGVLLLATAAILLYNRMAADEYVRPYELPEIIIFSMMGIFEVCIWQRLIPHNDNYAGFFAKLPMPVMITDRDFRSLYRSANAIDADESRLAEALNEPVYLTPDLKLSGRPITGGYAFWVEDESDMNKANERLLEANELLESENTLIEYENKQKAENAYLKSRHHIYHEIAETMYPYQKRIEELLGRTEPEAADFHDNLAYVSVLNAYVKRKTNMLLLASEKAVIGVHELMLAVTESARYLAYVGIKTSFDDSLAARKNSGDDEEEPGYPADTAIALYDTFEALAEQMIGRATLMMISFADEGIKLATDTEITPDRSLCALPVESNFAEGILYLTILSQKGGE